MLNLKEGEKEVAVELLEYEYPPGWGAGMPYDTDYIICKIHGRDGDDEFESEDSYFRFSEIESIYDNCVEILDGESYGFEAVIENPDLGFYVEIEEGDLAVHFQLAGEDLFSVCELMNPVEFREMVDSIDDDLRSIARM